jgi:hypothetical protein
MKKILLTILLIGLCVNLIECNTNIESSDAVVDIIDTTACAVATFVNIMDDDDVLGAVSLGKSLKYTDTRMSMFAVTYASSRSVFRTNLLKENGWTIFDSADILEQKHEDYDFRELDGFVKEKLSRFFVYMLVQYDIVVYLENDVIVSKNIDELCRCRHAKLGGASYVKKHNIGAMTLVPSKETFQNIASATYEKKIEGPYDLFEYFYKLQECPYFDPLLERFEAVPSQQCIRLPIRYNGDVVYQILSGWIDNQLDQPKILHYSIAGMKPWSWWSSILLPQYWIWSSSYLDALQDAEIMLEGTTLLWYMATFFVLAVFYFFPYTKKLLSFSLLGFLYNNPSFMPFTKLIIFHVINLLFIVFSFHYSNIYLTHPIMNILLFSLTLAGFTDVLLFNHMTSPGSFYMKLGYVSGSILFFSLFLNTWLFPVDFLFRFVMLISWFVAVHAILFTFLFVSIHRQRNSIHNRLQPPIHSSTKPSNPLSKLMNDLPDPSAILSQWIGSSKQSTLSA